MNEQEQMMQIISAISEKTGEAPEKVVAMLQEIMQTEGQEGVKAFIDKILNPEAEMFRKGGKMEAAVNKFQRGGVYNRAQGRQNKRDAGIYDDTEMADYTARGAWNQGAKIAKAKAVQGFENANFIDPEDFDRSVYRQRKREARNMDLTRRQRKAYALMGDQDVEVRDLPTGLISPIRERLNIPSRTPGKAVIEVGDITAEVIPNPTPAPSQNRPKVDDVAADPKTPVDVASYPQFFYENYYHDINTLGEMHPSKTLLGYQRAMQDEYQKYLQDPQNYRRGNIDPELMTYYQRALTGKVRDENGKIVREKLIHVPRAGSEYYDPNANYVQFGASQEPIPTSDTGKAMNKVAHGITGTILATAAAPKVAEGAVELGKGIYNGGKRLYETYRDAYKAQQQYLNQGGARGSRVRQDAIPTRGNHLSDANGYRGHYNGTQIASGNQANFRLPQQMPGQHNPLVPEWQLNQYLGTQILYKQGGKVNKCQDGEKVLDMIKKKKK